MAIYGQFGLYYFSVGKTRSVSAQLNLSFFKKS